MLQTVPEMGDGRAKVVGNVVGDLAHILHQALDAIQHGVDGLGQPVQFILGAAQWHAGFEISVHDGAAGPRDGIGAPQEKTADQETADHRGHQRGHDQPTSVRMICRPASLAR